MEYKVGMRTPWGDAQDVRTIAEGIVEVSTAGHGGIHLAGERQRAVKAIAPKFETWAGGPWYEEDCDVSLVILAHWEHFSRAAIRGAVHTVRMCASWERRDKNSTKWIDVEDWLDSDTPHAKSLLQTVADFETEAIAV